MFKVFSVDFNYAFKKFKSLIVADKVKTCRNKLHNSDQVSKNMHLCKKNDNCSHCITAYNFRLKNVFEVLRQEGFAEARKPEEEGYIKITPTKAVLYISQEGILKKRTFRVLNGWSVDKIRRLRGFVYTHNGRHVYYATNRSKKILQKKEIKL